MPTFKFKVSFKSIFAGLSFLTIFTLVPYAHASEKSGTASLDSLPWGNCPIKRSGISLVESYKSYLFGLPELQKFRSDRMFHNSLNSLFLNFWRCFEIDRRAKAFTTEESVAIIASVLDQDRTSASFWSVLKYLEHDGSKHPRAAEILKLLRAQADRDPKIGEFYTYFYDVERKLNGQKKIESYRYEGGGTGPTSVKLLVRKAPTGFLRAGSTYVDTQTRTGVEEVGTGNLVEAPDLRSGTQYVLTAAHVVSGQNPWIEIDGRRATILNALYDNDLDVALIEIAKTNAAPGAVINGTSAPFTLRISRELEHEFFRREAPIVQLASDNGSFWTIMLPLVPWADAGIEVSGSTFPTSVQLNGYMHVGHTFSRRQLKVSGKVTGGTSGSLTFNLYSKANHRIEGLITQSNYYFGETYLADAKSLAAHFARYLNGERGSTSATRWRMHNALTYREYAGGWSEANFIQQPTGRGIMIDSGKGVSGDPGKGVNGDPGKGVNGDPGKGVNGDPGKGVNGDPGKGVNGDPGLAGPWSNVSPNEIFRRYGIEPGMRLNGKPVVGIFARAKNPTPLPARMFFYADSHALEFMRDFGSDYDFAPIPSGQDLIRFARARVGAKPGETARMVYALGPPLETWHADKVPLRINPEIYIDENSMRLRIETYSKFGQNREYATDVVDITLDSHGGPLKSDQKSFLPIVEARGSVSGRLYYLDLRKLFFHDLSQVTLMLEDKKYLKIPEDKAEIGRQLEDFGITLRNSQTGQEFQYRFRRIPHVGTPEFTERTGP